MRFDILTIFPEQIEQYIRQGVTNIAMKKGLVDIKVHDLRKWSKDNHKSIDDSPFGGGAGMVMMIEPIYEAIKDIKKAIDKDNVKVIITTPRGKILNQNLLTEMSSNVESNYIILCGHYEGIDERVFDNLVDIEISLGDFVLSGGELPALVLVDGITRLIPGVLGNSSSPVDESFSNGLLEYPQYTRPSEFNNWKVPEILLSGNHSEIEKWRNNESKRITKDRRPDLVK